MHPPRQSETNFFRCSNMFSIEFRMLTEKNRELFEILTLFGRKSKFTRNLRNVWVLCEYQWRHVPQILGGANHTRIIIQSGHTLAFPDLNVSVCVQAISPKLQEAHGYKTF